MFDTSQCPGCRHWRLLAGMGKTWACHYRMAYESGPAKADGVCLSREVETKGGKKSWPLWTTGATTMDGYQRKC